MLCPVCERLEAEFTRMAGIHYESASTRERKWQTVPRAEYIRLKCAESDARLELEVVRAELKMHRRNEHEMTD